MIRKDLVRPGVTRPLLGALVVAGGMFTATAGAQEVLNTTPIEFSLERALALKEQAQAEEAPNALTLPDAPVNPDPMISYGPRGDGEERRIQMRERIRQALESREFGPRPSGKIKTITEKESEEGQNDALDNAQRLPRLNVGRVRTNTAIVSGSLGDIEIETLQQVEPDSGIPLALVTNVDDYGEGVRFDGFIGDDTFNPDVDDFDFVKVTIPPQSRFDFNVRTPEPFDGLDPYVGLFTEDGILIAEVDDGGNGFDTFGSFTYSGFEPLTVYLSIGSFGTFLPADPTVVGSGSELEFPFGSTGEYEFELRVFPNSADTYKLRLRKGDVLGLAARTESTPILRIFNSRQDFEKGVTGVGTFAVEESPLPIDGNGVIDYVVEKSGTYFIELSNSFGDYELEVGVFPPGFQNDPRRVQLIYLDYNGGPVNIAPYFGFPFDFIREFTPFREFLPNLGLPNEDHDVRRITHGITAEVRDNLQKELWKSRENFRLRTVITGNDGTGTPEYIEQFIEEGSFKIFGVTYEISEVEVSGTVPEAFINTIGIASEIDPGNYSANDSALVLLDSLTAPANPFGFSANSTFSLNDVVRAPGVSMEELAITAIGNVTAHEAGHYLGNFHTDGVFSDVASIMDEGPGGLFNLAGIGASGVFGSEDTVDVAFIDDTYSLLEGFDGDENTTVNTAYALTFSIFGW